MMVVEFSSIARNHAFGYSMTVGLLIRSTVGGLPRIHTLTEADYS
jgi:hypothetical protein